MSSGFYDSYFRDTAIGSVDVDTDTFKMMLVTSSYTFSKAHSKRSDITNEVVGTGYTAGGQAVVLTPTLDTVNHRFDLSIASSVWAGASLVARGAVIYKSRGGAASADELVGYEDFGADITSTAAPFTVNASSPWRVQN